MSQVVCSVVNGTSRSSSDSFPLVFIAQNTGLGPLNHKNSLSLMYSVIQKDGLSFVRLYFLNYTWYVNDLHNI